MSNRAVIAVVLMSLVLIQSSFANGFSGGRYMKSENPFSITFNAGYIGLDKGEVRETRRAYDPDQSGVPDYSAFLSAYTIEELGFDDNYLTLGVTMEKQWQYVTLHLNAMHANPNSEAVAKMKETASKVPKKQRGYYIGLEEVMYNGKNYEYMWIPDGTKFTADIETLLVEAKAKYTPFHVSVGSVHVSPWVHFGIYGGFASYEVDAGPAEGIVLYEVPPKEYVVKGKGTGSAGLAVPQIGGGGELRIDFGSMTNRPASFVLQGDFSWMRYNGSPSVLGVESTRHVDFNWLNIKVDAFLELPLNRNVDLIVGATYRIIRTDATLDSVHRTEEAQETLSEKYDKYAEFAITQITGNVGLRF